MTPRHPPRALTGLTTPIGAPPPGKEGGVELGGPRFGPASGRGVSRRGGRPGAVYRISLDLEGFLLLLVLRPGWPRGHPGRETVVWSMPLTRHPFLGRLASLAERTCVVGSLAGPSSRRSP